MKRTFVKGILSAAFVVTCVAVRGAGTVYSQNVVSYTNFAVASETSSILWHLGPFAFGETDRWYDANGNMLTPARSSTWFECAGTAFSIPMSPQCIETAGTNILLVFGTLLSGLVARKCLNSVVS